MLDPESDPRQYIDFTSGGIFAAGLGPDSEIIHEAIKRVRNFCSYAPKFGNYWRERYIEAVKEFTGFESVALFSTGAEACEAFWRCCRVYTNRPGIWGGLVDPDEVGTEKTRSDAMHGMTLGALIMAGRMNWPDLGYFPELGADRFGRNPGNTGGMIMEPYHAPSGQFHKIDPTIKRIQELRRVHTEIPLCIDEVQGGFGRTGKLWAHQHYVDRLAQPEEPYLKPDFVTIGKMAGGGLPLSALLGPKEIMESELVREFGHLHSTHSGNPVMCSVGLAVIDEIRDEGLIREARIKGEMMHDWLAKLAVRVHGKGLMAGIEFKNREECKRAVERIESRGVLVVDTGRKWIKLGPALNIEPTTLGLGLKIIEETVEEIVHERDVAPCGDSGQGQEAAGPDAPVLSETGV